MTMPTPRMPSDEPMLRNPESAGRRSRSEFINRLGIYLLGVAIGLLIVGMIWQARRASMIKAGVDPNQPMLPRAEPVGAGAGVSGAGSAKPTSPP